VFKCPADPSHEQFVGTQWIACQHRVYTSANGEVSRKVFDTTGDELTDCREHEVCCDICGATAWHPRKPVNFTPAAGMVLMCDFMGFRKPEIIKTRPVVVISERTRNYSTCIVAAISTVMPTDLRTIKVEIPMLKYSFLKATSYVKCEIVNTVRNSRLFLLRKNGAGIDSRLTMLEPADLAAVRDGVARAVRAA
jgi:uncharacterized protein YifN (PemK superfamily)